MVFTQIYLKLADFQTAGVLNGLVKYVQLNTNGMKKINLIGLNYVQDPGAGVKSIALVSDTLKLTRGNSTYFIFSTNQSNFVISPGTAHIVFNTHLVGNIDINLIDVATNAFPANFLFFILYLDIEDIPMLPLPEQHYKHPELKSHHR